MFGKISLFYSHCTLRNITGKCQIITENTCYNIFRSWICQGRIKGSQTTWRQRENEKGFTDWPIVCLTSSCLFRIGTQIHIHFNTFYISEKYSSTGIKTYVSFCQTNILLLHVLCTYILGIPLLSHTFTGVWVTRIASWFEISLKSD